MIKRVAPKCVYALGICALLPFFLIACGENPKSTTPSGVNAFDLPPSSGLGFEKADSIRNPAVLRAQSALLKVIIPTGEKVALSSLLKDPTLSLEQTYDKLKSKESSSIANDVLALQVRGCLNAGETTNCQVRPNFIQMSGFITSNGSQMAMSSQALFKILQNKLTSEQIATMGPVQLRAVQLEFLAYNGSNTLVVDETARPRLTSMTASYKNGVLTRDDLCSLTLQRPQSAYLRMAVNKTKSGDTVYIGGFPLKTVDRITVGAKDATGAGVAFTHGYVDTMKQAYDVVGKNWNALADEEKILLNMTGLAMRIDATTEMIGGPVINESGEYVGMLTSTESDLTKKYSFAIQIN